jgi:hypothetical protein
METIQEMAKLTVLSGRINELQQKNLKTFPLVYFNGVSKVEVNYDLSTAQGSELGKASNKSSVSYYLTIDENAPNSNIEKRFEALVSSVKSLFWNNIKITVYFNNLRVFESFHNIINVPESKNE